MKTIKLLLIGILFVSFSSINAQNESNDATWKETIAFLSKYKNYQGVSFPKWYNPFGEVGFSKYLRTEVAHWSIKINVENNFLPLQKLRITIDLDKIKNVYSGSNKYLIIKLVGDYCNVRTERFGKRGERNKIEYKNGNEIFIKITDDQMRPRIKKAMQHLAYLNKLRNEKQRKNSGEKF